MRKVLLLILVLFSVNVLAHEKHHHTKPVQSTPAKSEPAPSKAVQPEVEMEEEPEEEVPGFKEALLSHPHNKIVHFPLAFGIAGSLFMFLSVKKPEILTAVRVLWLLAALAAVAAYFTGQSQEEPFEEGALHDVVELHEKLGIATGICLGLGFLISLNRRWKGLGVIWAIILVALISVTGYYGGILAH